MVEAIAALGVPLPAAAATPSFVRVAIGNTGGFGQQRHGDRVRRRKLIAASPPEVLYERLFEENRRAPEAHRLVLEACA